MKRPVKAMVAAIALTLTFALPAGAGAETKWVCVVDGETVTFVSAADAARHGSNRPTAGQASCFTIYSVRTATSSDPHKRIHVGMRRG